MEKQRPSFLIYKDSFEVLQELSDEDLGKVFRMIFEYTIHGVIPDKKDKNYIAFSFIKLHLDRDSKKYSDIIERNKLNGSKGGRPNKPKKPTGLINNPKNPSKPKKPDIDIDIDSDIERERGIEITLKKNNTKKKKHPFDESIYNQNEELFYQDFEKTKTAIENPSIDKKKLYNTLAFSDSAKYQYSDWIKVAQNWYNRNPKEYQISVSSILEKDQAYQMMTKGQKIIYEQRMKLDLQKQLINNQHDESNDLQF